jgi:hypothetical protein
MNDFAVFSRPQFRAGAGIFSGGDPLVWFGNAFQNDGSTVGEGTDATQAADCRAGHRSTSLRAAPLRACPAASVPQVAIEAARGLATPRRSIPNQNAVGASRFNAGFSSELNFAESGFFSGWNLTLDYIYSKYKNPFTVVDLSQAR